MPRTGHAISFEGLHQSLTQVRPMARRVEDLALVLPIIAGPDGVDPHIVDMPLRDPAATEEGLPIGVQVLAPPWQEDRCLAVAAWLERQFGGWRPPEEVPLLGAADGD